MKTELRAIAITTIAILPIMAVGAIFQFPPKQVGVAAVTVAFLVGLFLGMYLRGFIHWKILRILIPMEQKGNRDV